MARLPILMYHNVSLNKAEAKGLTISAKELELQFSFLKENGYQTLHFADLQKLKSAKEFPKKAVILTFDDVYVNQLELAYPLLEKYKLKACFYVPFKYVGATDEWNDGDEKIMTVKQLQSLNSDIVELGLHSFAHGKYSEMTNEAIDEDFNKCKEFIMSNQLNVHNTLAYPYGKYPRKGDSQHDFFKILQDNKIAYGLRIGNRVNDFPFKNNYEVKRIDIKGEDTLFRFKMKLRFGKVQLF